MSLDKPSTKQLYFASSLSALVAEGYNLLHAKILHHRVNQFQSLLLRAAPL